jgi:DKNYY family
MKYSGAAMLEFLGEHYARDRQHVYFRRKLVRGAAPATFWPLRDGWATDRNAPFLEGRRLGLTDGWFNSDVIAFFTAHPELHDYWYFSHPLIVAERRLRAGGWSGAVTLLGHGFVQIDELVFLDGIPLFNIDAASLHIHNRRLYRDDVGVYWSTTFPRTFRPDGSPWKQHFHGNRCFTASEEVDPATFELLRIDGLDDGPLSGYARDRADIFWYGELKRMAADGESFRVITRRLAVDRSHVFYCGEAAEFATPGDLDLLAMADPAYFRSAGKVFRYGKLVKTPKIDAESFTVITNDLVADRDRVYGYCERLTLSVLKKVARSDIARAADGRVQYRGKLYDAAAVSRLLVKYCVDAFDHLDEAEEAGNAGRGWDDLRHWAEHRIEDGVVRCGPFALDDADPGSFRMLVDGYARDDRSLWFGHERLARVGKIERVAGI